MTKEERAAKWFENVPGAERLSLKERMDICDRVARGTTAIILSLLAAECIILFLVSGGTGFDQVADAIDRFAEGLHGPRQYRSLALYGVILLLPFLALPIVAGMVYRRSRLRAAAERAHSDRGEEPATQTSQTSASLSGVDVAADVEETGADAEAAWLKLWEEVKGQFDCRIDLEAYFKKQEIGAADLDVLDLGTVHFPTGQVVACDPFVELGDATPYIQTIPAGLYPVKIAVSDSDIGGIRYACAKVEVSDKIPARYELAMTGKEKLDQEFDEGDYFGFAVDTSMACVADQATQLAFHGYWQNLSSEDYGMDPFNDLFSDLLEESYQKHPKYQSELGDWLSWRVPGTDCDLAIFSSGWGDGSYPVYFGYDAARKVSGIYVHLIDVEAEFGEVDTQAGSPESSEKNYTSWARRSAERSKPTLRWGEIGRQLDAITSGRTQSAMRTGASRGTRRTTKSSGLKSPMR